MSDSFGQVTLLERGPIFDRLREHLDNARAGNGQVVIVHGEAGIGKTEVVRAFTVSHESEAHVLWASCDDLLVTRPLGPVWDLAAQESQLLPILESDARLTVFRSIIELLERALRPTVLVIEDVHWADDASLDLIKYVGRRIDRTNGLLILTYRDTDLTTEHPLRTVLGDLPQEHLERIQLKPLSKEAVRLLVSNEARVERIWKISGGNPFYVTELAESSPDNVPESIKDSIRARRSRLTPSARNLVELVSVAPRRLRTTVIQEILGDVTPLITECERSGILQVTGDSLSFRHELARQAVEQDLGEARRRELNHRALTASENLGEPDLTRLAHHARQAQDPEAMLRLLPEAAKQAHDLESHREALSHLRALRPYLERMTPRQLADHYHLWAWEEYLENPATANRIGDRAVAQARLVEDPRLLGRALIQTSRTKWMNARRSEAEMLAEEAVDVLKQIGGEDLAMAYAGLSELAMLAIDEDGTRRWVDLALAQADEGPSYARAQALVNRGAMAATLRFPDGVADLEEAYRTGMRHGFPRAAGRAVSNLGELALLWRRIDIAEPWIHLLMEMSLQHEWAILEYFHEASMARLQEMRGHWSDAEARIAKVLDRRVIHAIPELMAMIVMARILTRRGDAEAPDIMDNLWERATRNSEIHQLAPAGAVIAEHAWLGSEVGDERLQELVSILHQCVELEVFWYGGDLAQYLALLGVIDKVPEVLPDPYVALNRGDWEEAAAYWEQRGLPYERAVALSHGDVAARAKALTLLNDLGAKPLAARVRRELQDAGLKHIPRGPYTATRENPLGLTPRQTQVLELLNENLTNREVASRLFVSVRTVENHVSAILTKLDVSDRTEAVRLARESQLFS
jgi:DNA-binding CsgD family transcriptional regulator